MPLEKLPEQLEKENFASPSAVWGNSHPLGPILMGSGEPRAHRELKCPPINLIIEQSSTLALFSPGLSRSYPGLSAAGEAACGHLLPPGRDRSTGPSVGHAVHSRCVGDGPQSSGLPQGFPQSSHGDAPGQERGGQALVRKSETVLSV